MDIRSYFKGDSESKTPPKFPPPRQGDGVLELPDFLFISARSGVKRDRSTVAENIEDSQVPDGFEPGLHRVLSPLEVRIMHTDPKVTHPAPKRKKRSKNIDDTFFFSDDVDEQARMFAAHKEKLEKYKTNIETQHGKPKSKKKKQAFTIDDEDEKKPPEKPKTANPTPLPPSRIQNQAQTTHTINAVTTTTKKSTTTTMHSTHIFPNTTTPTPSQHSVSLNHLNNLNSKNNLLPPSSLSKSAHEHTNSSGNTHPLPKMDDKELEEKVHAKMEEVQKWQNRCSELRKQLAESATILAEKLEELDNLNSLYENSNA